MQTTTVTYQDFDGSTKSTCLEVHEPRPGEFYVQNLSTLGCSKTYTAEWHWKPIRVAICDILGGRTLLDYTVPK